MDNTGSNSFLLTTKLSKNPINTALWGTKNENLERKSAVEPLGADGKKHEKTTTKQQVAH